MQHLHSHHFSSRRHFLLSSLGVGGGLLLSPRSSSAYDSAVADVLSQTIGVDMHNHVYPAGTEPHPHWGNPNGKPHGDGQPAPSEQLSLSQELKNSGLTAVCASFVLDFAVNKQPGDARENLLRWFTTVDKELNQGGIHRALTLRDLQTAHHSQQPVIVQSVEGSMFIEGHLDRVQEVYNHGLRHLQLLHEHDDMVSPLGDVSTAPAHLGGLTPFGAQVIKECNRLGIVVDLAHASHETVLSALKVSSQPLIISHTSLDSRAGANPEMVKMMAPRLISKEHAKVVANAGGIVGVWTHLAASVPDFVQSIKATADAIGVDHVGIGSDTDLLSARVGSGTNCAWQGMTEGFFPSVVSEMLREGFAPGEIAKIGGGNYCRVFGEVTGGHA